jgi:hypothetical protein
MKSIGRDPLAEIQGYVSLQTSGLTFSACLSMTRIGRQPRPQRQERDHV